MLFSGKWALSLNVDGVKTLLEYWADFSPLITLFMTSLTLYVANTQLAKHLDIQAVEALSNLREKLNSREKKKINHYLLPKDDKVPIIPEIDKSPVDDTIEYSTIELYDYIGVIELGAIMVKRGLITMDEFYNQFGYRVENLLINSEIMKHINNEPEYYKEFLFIISYLLKYKNHN